MTMIMLFPGMDPYLEHPLLWEGCHPRMIVEMANQIGRLIRPRYVASVEERVFIEKHQQQRIPDLRIHQVREIGCIATMPLPTIATPVVVEVQELEIKQHFIEVLDRYHDLNVVTVIELVSPSNKTAGPGRNSYLEKQEETLASQCHLVEIDLFPRNGHVLKVPEDLPESFRLCDFLISVHRWPDRKNFELCSCHLRDRLPSFGVPLATPDPDVPLDLQAALEKVYDDAGYMLRVRYDEPCVPPLEPADQQWANECWAAYKAARKDLFPETTA